MQQTATTDPFYFLSGKGEMARLMRQKDWSQTPLGLPETWPQSLRTIVSTCLNSRFPILIWWGPELVMLYNDAYKPILGDKHPYSLGSRGQAVWSEIWDVIGPMLTGVLTRGEATWSENQRLLINRHGYEEESFFTFSYSPIHDESNGIGGVFCAVTETTATVLAERQLRERDQRSQASEEQLRNLIAQAPVAIWVLRGTSFVVDIANDRQLAIWGKTAEDVLGKPVFEVLPEATGQGFEELLTGVLQTGEPLYFAEAPTVLPAPDGKTRTGYFNATVQALRDIGPDGRPCPIHRLIAVNHEVTEQVLARQRIEANEQLLNNIFEQAPTAIALFKGNDFVIERANPLICQLWGRSREQVMGKPLFEALPEASGQGFEELLTGVLQTGEPFVGHELPATLQRNGRLETVYFDFVYHPFPQVGGAVDQILLVAEEVTERMQTRLAQVNESARLQSLFEQAPVGVGVVGPGPDFVYEIANAFYCEMAGRAADQLIGKPLLKAMPELVGQGFETLIGRVMETGVVFQSGDVPVHVIRNGQPDTVWTNFVYQPRRSADGSQITGVVIIVTNITPAVLARQQVEASEIRLRSIIANAPVAMALFVGHDLLVELPTQTFIEVLGKGTDIAGKPLREVMPELVTENQPFLQLLAEVYTSGQLFQASGLPTKVARDGVMTDSYYNVAYTPLWNDEGEVFAVLGIATDVTEQIKAQQQVEESESRYRQLAAELEERVMHRTRDLERSNLDLIQFASVASHDLKEPLRKIQTFGSRLQEMLAGRMNEEETDLFRRLINSAARMQTLVNDVLQLSKLADQTIRFEPVDLNAIISQLREDLDLPFRELGAEVFVGPLPTVLATPGQMHQLFLNLISNALKFQDKRRPEIRIEPASLTTTLSEQLGQTSSEYVVIAVQDNGIGFDLKFKDKIFGMFQRLHGRSQYAGTGIGLTIVKKIVENHRGFIDVQSEPGRGTTFWIALPVGVATR